MGSNISYGVEGVSGTAERLSKIVNYVSDQIAQINLRMLLVQVLLAPLPRFVAGQIRAIALRAVGFSIGERSGFYGTPRVFGRGDITRLLTIGERCWFNIDCHFDLSDTITIGDGVGVGPEVMIMTGSHELGPEHQRVGDYITAPVTIEDGVWIGARCVILPGVTIGRGSVIAAGTVVNRDVPPNTVVSISQRMSIEKWQLFTKNGAKPTVPTEVKS